MSPVPDRGGTDHPAPAPAGGEQAGGRLGTRAQVVLAVAVTSFVLLVVGSRTWLDVAVAQPLGGDGRVDVAGTRAAPTVPALALVALASAGALTIARRTGRLLVLAVLGLAGAGAAVAAVRVLFDPSGAARPSVAEATGLTSSSVTADAAAVAVTGWVLVAVVVAVLLVALAVRGAVTARRWPTGRRFDPASAPGSPPEAGTGPARAGAGAGGVTAGTAEDRAEDWDALTRGDDPTVDDEHPGRDEPTRPTY